MSRTIVLWGVILCGCVCGPQPLQASSLEWEDGCQPLHLEGRVGLSAAPSEPPLLADLWSVPRRAQPVVTTTHRLQWETLKIAQTQVPVLALPESGTLILLGLGLAGLAALMRRPAR